ncbi:MAG: hypothetical protein IJ089_12695 [Clostridia bacterium]|nr:hypothetical protein [Clostridia bacterium]
MAALGHAALRLLVELPPHLGGHEHLLFIAPVVVHHYEVHVVVLLDEFKLLQAVVHIAVDIRLVGLVVVVRRGQGVHMSHHRANALESAHVAREVWNYLKKETDSK